MVTIMQLTDNLKSYISLQLESMAKTNPMIGFMKPLITRALDKNFSKVSKALDLIADKDGNIDIEQKIVESAIVFWFKDADCKAENKVVEYLGEY